MSLGTDLDIGRNRLSNKNEIFARLGDFWHFNIKKGKDLRFVRQMTHTQDYNRVLSDIREMPKHLSGQEEWNGEFDSLRYVDSDVLALGGDLQERVLTILGIAADANLEIPAYIIRKPSHRPTTRSN